MTILSESLEYFHVSLTCFERYHPTTNYSGYPRIGLSQGPRLVLYTPSV